MIRALMTCTSVAEAQRETVGSLLMALSAHSISDDVSYLPNCRQCNAGVAQLVRLGCLLPGHCIKAGFHALHRVWHLLMVPTFENCATQRMRHPNPNPTG